MLTPRPILRKRILRGAAFVIPLALTIINQACGGGFASTSNAKNDNASGIVPEVTPIPQSKFKCDVTQDPSPSTLRRLSKREYAQTISDLFGPNINALTLLQSELAGIPEENASNAFDTVDLSLAQGHIDGYFNLADVIAGKISASTTYINSVAGSCMSLTTPAASCVEAWIESFGKKSFRRPLTASEKVRFKSLFQTIQSQDGARSALRVSILAFLSSPNFLYRVETEGSLIPGRQDLYKISPYEMASRISYFATGSMPDETLFAAAADGSILTDAGLKREIDRLMRTDRAKSVAREFFTQWLRLSHLPDSNYPASFTQGLTNLPALRDSIVKDVEDYIDQVVWVQKGTFKDLMTSNVAVVRTADMAAIYGVTSTSSTPIQLDSGTRAGLLTRPAFLLAGSQQTSPFHRATTVLRRVLCNQIPSPDPNISPGALTPPVLDPNKTTRERFTAKTSGASCVGCHSMINPLGFALESFDSLGRYRQTEQIFDANGNFVKTLPIDSTVSANIDGRARPIRNGIDLAHQLGESRQASSCFIEQVQKFASGREVASADGCRLARMENALLGPEGSVEKMFISVMEAPEFKLQKVSP